MIVQRGWWLGLGGGQEDSFSNTAEKESHHRIDCCTNVFLSVEALLQPNTQIIPYM